MMRYTGHAAGISFSLMMSFFPVLEHDGAQGYIPGLGPELARDQSVFDHVHGRPPEPTLQRPYETRRDEVLPRRVVLGAVVLTFRDLDRPERRHEERGHRGRVIRLVPQIGRAHV